MTITIPLEASGAEEATSLPARERSPPNSWLECQREALDAEALYRELSALSDEELAKLGIERAGIPRAVYQRIYGGGLPAA